MAAPTHEEAAARLRKEVDRVLGQRYVPRTPEERVLWRILEVVLIRLGRKLDHRNRNRNSSKQRRNPWASS